MRAALEVRNLTKQYDDVTAVDDLSFEVYEGEIFVLPGRAALPAGANEFRGYTTLMAPIPPETITVEGTTLALAVERKRVKNVNARLRGSTLFVSAPPDLPPKRLHQIANEMARKLVRRAHAQRANSEEDALALAAKVARRFPQPPVVKQVVFVTTQRARWGSYSQRTNTIRLNAALRFMPRWVVEAVVAHELAHAVHLDHSAAFWELLHSVCPQTGRAQAFLEGVSWLGSNWKSLPGVELALLAGTDDDPSHAWIVDRDGGEGSR